MIKKIILTFVLILNINLNATDYDDDAAKVDFYVPGILANDALSQVNFLLCFQANTNFGTFANAGPYKVLIDEAACETADGADAAAELQAATGGSSEVATDSAVAAVEEVVYSPGIMNITSDADGKLNGVGWFDIVIDMDDNVTVDSTAYVQTTLRQDVGAGRPYGNFTLLYEIKTNEAVTVSGNQIPLGTAILKGYLDVEGNTLKYYEDGPNFTPRGIVGVLGTNKRNGYLLTNIQKFSGNPPNTTVDWYQARYKLFQDLTAKVYCQKFDRAIKYNVTAQGLQASTTTYEDATAFNNEIAAAFTNPATAFLSLEGGTKATVRNENCWSTDIAEATRVVYEYGTYLDTTGARYDLPSTSLSLEANTTDNSLNQNIYAHASYHGTHVRDSDKSLVNSNIIFKNQRDSLDTANYSLTKNYYQVWKKTSATKALNQLDGVGFQWYVDHLKNNDTWKLRIGALGFNWPTTGNCDANGRNCPEYSGYISVNSANNVVTFTATHGMNWNTSPPTRPFELSTPLTFTSTQWTNAMTRDGMFENMYFHNPDSREQYRLPYNAFSNTTAANVKITVENKVDISTLDGKTFVCVERCLGKTNLDSAIDAAFTAVDAGANAAILAKTPYVDRGPFFKVKSYYDAYVVTGDQDGNEPDVDPGRYNNIGGVVNAELSTYTVTNGVLEGDNADGGNIEWTNDQKTKLDQSKYRDGIRKYQYRTKNPSYTVDNWTRQYGHSFRMTAIDVTDKESIKCDLDANNNSKGYTNKWRAQSTGSGYNVNDSLLVTGNSYYCGQKIREGVVDSYVFELLKRPDYKILKDSQAVTISPPKNYEYAVPASGITYNFSNTNLAGKKFTFKFEGFGNLHNFPGRVFNTCTGDVVGRYVDSWDECYRYIPEFTLPDAAILTDKTGNEDIRVRALRGDEFLKQFATNNLPGNRTYADNLVLPTESDLVAVSSVIGTKPTSGILNGGKASVIHGETVTAPSP